MATLLADDEALMEFGYSFLKHALFGEQFLQEREGAYEERMQRLKAKGERLREEYLANREQLEDEKYAEPGRPGDLSCGTKDCG